MPLSRISASCLKRLRSTASSFARDDEGGATIWNVTWLLVFAGMAGLSIDSSNGFRNKTISQSTSDAAALAGVYELPNPLDNVPYEETPVAAVKASALEYAGINMRPEIYGSVLSEDEIFIGHWNTETRQFTPGDAFPETDPPSVNAVRVYLFQDEAGRGNGVPTSLMHMVGMPFWSVSTTATAMGGYPLCAANAFMAHRKYCQTSNSTYGPDICIWADEGLFLKNGNVWQGNIVQTPPGANNEGIADGNLEDENFHLSENVSPALDVQFVEDIATFNDGTPGIAYDILSGGSSYAQKVTTGALDASGNPVRAAPGGTVVPLQINTIGTDGSAWLNAEPSFQVASLDGFASVAGLLGVATHAPKGQIPPGCPQTRSKGSLVEPIGDFDYEILGIEKGGQDLYPDVDVESAAAHTSPELTARTIYYHNTGSDLTINGDLDSVVVVTTGSIILTGNPVLTDVTLVSLEDRKGGEDGLKMTGASPTLGSATGECEEEGGVKIYTMGSFVGSSGAQFNGAFIAAGGNVGFAASADSEQGVSVYSAGNIFHTSNNTITSCGVPITFDPDNLRYSIVE